MRTHMSEMEAEMVHPLNFPPPQTLLFLQHQAKLLNRASPKSLLLTMHHTHRWLGFLASEHIKDQECPQEIRNPDQKLLFIGKKRSVT